MYQYLIIIFLLLISESVNLGDLIEPADLQEILNFWTGSDTYYYVCGTLNDFNKTCRTLRLIKSCGANDVCYYSCGDINDSNKTCGAHAY